jgi:hypothetical protein
MHVGKDQRVMDRSGHTSLIAGRCYRVMKCAPKLGQ